MSEVQTKTMTCAKHGKYQANYIELFGREICKSKCPACEAINNEVAKNSQAAAESYERQRRVNQLHCDVPKRFGKAGFDNYQAPEGSGESKALGTCKRFAEKFPELSDIGAGMIFCGSLGTGKTHLAISIAKHVVSLGFAARYMNVMNIIKLVRETWDREAAPGAEREVMKQLTECDLLVIDEVGAQMGTENERNILFEIINGRYENVKSTIVISNLDRKEVASLISERSVDRITEGGGVLTFNWQSYRGRKAA